MIMQNNSKLDIHAKICDYIKDLYAKKNADYGDSYSLLRKRYPISICIRLADKLNRLDRLLDPNYQQKVNDESIEDTLLDIANYAIIEVTERRNEKNGSKNN